MASPYRIKLDDLITRGEEADKKLAEALEAYNGAVADAWAVFKDAAEEWETEREDIVEEVQGQAEAIRSTTDGYSEKWAESPKGQKVLNWLDTIEAFEIAEFSPDEPGEEKNDDDIVEVLQGLAETPEE